MLESLVSRCSPELADNFIFEIIEAEDGKNVFSYEESEGKVLLKGDCALSLAVAYFHFMRDCCGGYFTAEHSLAYGEFVLPSERKEGKIKGKYRTYFEYTSFSCASCWWNWERWEKEIDFMAMNGINMPLTVVGTEAVWLKTMLDLGMHENLALAGLSGPSFWGWQLSDCFDGYLPQATKESVDRRLELGRKIADRERELGMTPVMQGFTGYIFRNFIQGKVRARMKKAEEWCLFPSQYQISVRDRTFHKIGSIFYKNQALLLGEAKYFFADPFGAHAPAKNDSGFIAGLGTAVYQLVSAQSENSVWLVHSSGVTPAMFRGIPKDRVIIVDDSNKCFDESFEGFEMIVGTRFNNCDVTAVHGDISAVAGARYNELRQKNSAICGIGSFSDGAYSNEAFRQYALACMSGDVDVDAWLEKYVSNRYCTDSEAAFEAMKLLRSSCWMSGQPSREHGSAICTRPTTLLRHTSIGDRGNDIEYNIADVFTAACKLLEANGNTYEYELDLCDVLRQSLSDLANVVCKKALDGYKEKDVQAFEENTNLFLGIIEDIDRLMLTKKEFSLPHYLSLARDAGGTDAEKQNYEINVLSQVSIFGPVKDTVMYDCCWKEWGGMLSSLYALRWRALFEILAASFKKLRRLPEKTRRQAYDRDLYLGSEFGGRLSRVEKEWIATYSPDSEAVGRENTVDVANELVSKYKANF